MRDFDQMVGLLQKMADKPDGSMISVATMGMGEDLRKQRHQLRLLEDAGLAIWQSDSMVRITNEGYDFLGALNSDRPNYTEIGKKLLSSGKSFLQVANHIISIADKL